MDGLDAVLGDEQEFFEAAFLGDGLQAAEIAARDLSGGLDLDGGVIADDEVDLMLLIPTSAVP